LIRHKHIPTAGIGEFIAAVTATPDGFTDGLTGITIIIGTDTGIIIDYRFDRSDARGSAVLHVGPLLFLLNVALTEDAQAA
jgi:hypothetical protein